jgi:6-phosphogluconolactonase
MSDDLELHVVDDPAREVAALLVEAARAGDSIYLSGGSTPRRAYELAAAQLSDWSRASLWWSDERAVPPWDERSNYRMAREAFLDRIFQLPEVHRILGELPAEEAAAAYDEEVRGGELGLVLLGIGPDGHTASLFPRAPSLDERERLVVAAEAGLEPFVSRVTVTLPAIAAAREAVFLVAGADKAEAVERAFARPPSPDTPSSLARGRRTVAYLDQVAAARLPG